MSQFLKNMSAAIASAEGVADEPMVHAPVRQEVVDFGVDVPALPVLPVPVTTEHEMEYIPPEAQRHNAAPTINFESILKELHTWHSQNSGNLNIPTNHPIFHQITDVLTNSSMDRHMEQRYNDQLEALKLYKAQHGNCNVPLNHPTLGKWVRDQREYYKQYEQNELFPNNNDHPTRPHNPLTKEKYEALRDIGIASNLWEKRLVELRQYKATHGHTDVPLDHPGLLGVWVLNQRDNYYFSKGNYPKERIDALEELGFNWNRWGRNRIKARKDAWDEQFNKLVEYIQEHGHSNISQHDKEHERLGKWIKNQRYEYRKYTTKGLGPSRLGRDRIDKLNEIGFLWRLRPEKIPWETRFKALVEYKEQHGTCRVPMNVPELGKWAKYQRDQYCLFMKGKKAKISQEKIDKLMSIGFNESLEERVVLGLNADEEEPFLGGVGNDDEAAATHQVTHQAGEVVYQHHGEHQQQQVYVDQQQYHHQVDPTQQQQQHHGALYGDQQQQQQGGAEYNYQQQVYNNL